MSNDPKSDMATQRTSTIRDAQMGKVERSLIKGYKGHETQENLSKRYKFQDVCLKSWGITNEQKPGEEKIEKKKEM